jgi:putative flippase GtrA
MRSTPAPTESSTVTTPTRFTWPPLLVRLLRSAGAGGVATLVDLASLTTMVSLLGLDPRVASVPALTLGSVAMFFGQKHFVFRSRARGAHVAREMVLFALVQIVGLLLNAALYDRLLLASPFATHWYVAARLLTTNVVWLAFSFPAWHYVFRKHPGELRGG